MVEQDRQIFENCQLCVTKLSMLVGREMRGVKNRLENRGDCHIDCGDAPAGSDVHQR